MKNARIIPIALAILAFSVQLSRADIHRRHGALCAPKHTSIGVVGADERGAYNTSPSVSAKVTCPVVDRTQYKQGSSDTWGGETSFDHWAPHITNITVYGRDLSTTTPFSCYLFWTEDMGYSSWAPRKYACSAAGGCPDSTTEYTGMVSMSWDVGSAPIGETTLVGAACDIPPTTALGDSYVKSIRTVDARRFVVGIYHLYLEGDRFIDEFVSNFYNN